jgi:hypothetical protein
VLAARSFRRLFEVPCGARWDGEGAQPVSGSARPREARADPRRTDEFCGRVIDEFPRVNWVGFKTRL